MAANFDFRLENLRILRDGTIFFNDDFADGTPPPAGAGSINYNVNGTILESGGDAILAASGAQPSTSPTGVPRQVVNATLLTNMSDDSPTLGLKSGHDIDVFGNFDLIMPSEPGSFYGIRFSDRATGQGLAGDDVVQLVVGKALNGTVYVDFTDLDFVNGTVTLLERHELTPGSADHILLHLSHDDAQVGVVHASYSLITNGVEAPAVDMAATAQIFQGETWTRAQVVASSLDTPVTASFNFRLDSFTVLRDGAVFFQDSFEDGNPPPVSPPGFTQTYSVNGEVEEIGGDVIFNSALAEPSESPTGQPWRNANMMLRTNIDPSNLTAGLRNTDDIDVTASFDLVLPNATDTIYGIRLTDRATGLELPGDDVVQLVVRRAVDGQVYVEYRQLDWVHHTSELLSRDLLTPGSADHINLHLSHDNANLGVVTASYTLTTDGVESAVHTLSATGHIFSNENWTRAQVVAAASDGLVVGDAESNVLLGAAGSDFLDGGEGDDELLGGDGGIDTLIGGAGNDSLDGGPVDDPATQGNFLFGGEGDDTYHVRNTFDLVDEGYVRPEFGFGGNDTVISSANWFWDVYGVGEIDRIAEDAADPNHAGVTFVGGIFDNTLIGHSGTDILFGRGGNDTYIPGDGIDWISLSTLGLTDQNAYAGVDGHNTIIVTPRISGANSYDIMFDFDPAKDKVDVSAYHQYASGADLLSHAVDDGLGSSYIALGDGLDFLYFVGLTKDHLLASDFVV
ncbi:MAG: hypothetical protein M9932_06405 [Xanthobacteraceae bacterium]|nr:hypothetical protein [Xanthobacteraceae bacterium]